MGFSSSVAERGGGGEVVDGRTVMAGLGHLLQCEVVVFGCYGVRMRSSVRTVH